MRVSIIKIHIFSDPVYHVFLLDMDLDKQINLMVLLQLVLLQELLIKEILLNLVILMPLQLVLMQDKQIKEKELWQ